MTTRKSLAIAAVLLIWGGVACSGQTESSGNSGGSGSDGDSSDSSDSASGGSGTGGNTATSADSGSDAGGTGGTNSASCPSVEPLQNSYCSDEGERCAYINCQPPRYGNDHTLTCMGSAWVLTDEVVCDIPVSCPAGVASGAVCDASSTPGPCRASDACGMAQTLYCSDGRWGTTVPDGAEDRAAPAPTGAVGTVASATTGFVPTPSCPADPPVLGSACCPSYYPETCDYSMGAGGSSGFGAPAPGVGGAVSSTVISTIGPTTADSSSGSGGNFGAGGSGSAGAPPVAECATCSADQVWEASDACQ
jgi:hypothetical protein